MADEAGAGAPGVTEIRLDREARTLRVAFTDGTAATFEAELLRVMSPSAEVQGHGPAQHVTVPGKRHVGVAELEPVGNYAVRIVFDDGHDTGIFSWAFLHELARERGRRWGDYLRRLEREGLSRDP